MNTKGYTILFTVLMTSIILAIALGVSRISYTEAVLSSVAREGGEALFAADTGLECGLYQDIENNVFIPPVIPSFDCGGAPTFITYQQGFTPSVPQSSNRYFMEFDGIGSGCSRVYIYKDWTVDNETYTQVESFGYNKTCQEVNSHLTQQAIPDLVERALRARYINNIQLGGGQGQTQGQGQGQVQ